MTRCAHCLRDTASVYTVYIPRMSYLPMCRDCYAEVMKSVDPWSGVRDFIKVSKRQYELELLKRAL